MKKIKEGAVTESGARVAKKGCLGGNTKRRPECHQGVSSFAAGKGV